MISLLGTWQLLRVRATNAAGQPLEHHQYGPEPTGIVQFGAKRMQAATGDGRAVLPPGVKRFWSAYTGNYTFDGQTLITRVDDSNLAERIGGDQVRKVRAEGTGVWLKPPPRMVDGAMQQLELYWERIG
ncbi:MAG: lipocalin-like domain-containing protein [Roseomonas sp.]|jgi:hypothetical protein|nr:lipocalin-like domain-containing protein [Roseomonas sp.]